MKFIPLLLRTPMVESTLAGIKVMTRRTRGLTTFNKNPEQWSFDSLLVNDKGELHAFFSSNLSTKAGLHGAKCPYGNTGDVLWVRETWSEMGLAGNYIFKADGVNLETDYDVWHPNIHMPKAACRLFLQITDIRIERVQEITPAAAKAEGIEPVEYYGHMFGWKNYLNKEERCNKATESFSTLWQSINGEESWKENVWVWVISFKQIDEPDEFMNPNKQKRRSASVKKLIPDPSKQKVEQGVLF